jgi:hypothetical protein
MYAGSTDELDNLTDVHQTRDLILNNGKGKDILVHYQEVNGGHASFMVGSSMKYFEDVVKQIRKYNPVSAKVEARDE